jgi:hypothetical protein
MTHDTQQAEAAKAVGFEVMVPQARVPPSMG